MTLTLTNARLVLAEEVLSGTLSVAGGLITDIGTGTASAGAIDLGGDYLIPGLVELHTDQFENHYRPRPGVFWDALAALHAHDVQIAGSGITTVFDAVRIGSAADLRGMGEHVERQMGAIERATAENRLRAEHFVHLRCELPTEDVVEHFEIHGGHDLVRLASIMDHTPGQRQFRSLDAYRQFYQTGRTGAELEAYIAERLEEHARYADDNRRRLVVLARERGVTLASHDDATIGHVEEAVENGVGIAEFPTTLEAAAAAHDAGLAILMGAPNVVRGGSHSGNVSATDLVHAKMLDILSSDYVPFSLLQAVFALPNRVDAITLPEAMALVTRNPARAVGLDDRGELAVGKRADLVQVSLIGGTPVVRSVWRAGRRVS